ncbi:MAG TPA: FAD-dependent monooxygenase [Gemmatimonadales bacterium]|jgi:2-polyprenyl-6-methoxyphenol hydroxylase-like FAD-dependent oxidoreductase
MASGDVDVLIAGAGPTGLVLALWLARRGVRLRIVDKAAAPGTTSRALAVQARTLEFYQQLGFADVAIARGVEVPGVNLWAHGRHLARAPLSLAGEGITRFPYMLVLPQELHERLMIEQLEAVGVHVERGVEVISFRDLSERVETTVRSGDVTSSCISRYLVGCDGASSVVRQGIGAGFPGGTYQRMFYVADVEATGAVANNELHVVIDDADFLLVFPLRDTGTVRLVGTVVANPAAPGSTLTWEDVSQRVIGGMGISVHGVKWFSTYHVHHRVADTFRRGRVFLAGDAAHIHSPVGGQGMNTGIGDAVNLAWKLADVIQRRANATLLDSYEPERIGFARQLVQSTDRAFTFVTRDGFIARTMRSRVVPRLFPWLLRRKRVQRFLYRTVSQTEITYRHVHWNAGRAGSVRGGDRLPWIKLGQGQDNFAPLASLDWQMHVYGDVPTSLRVVCDEHGIPIHRFAWDPSMQAAGLQRDAGYLIRPDGYVALAGATGSMLRSFLAARGLGHGEPRTT